MEKEKKSLIFSKKKIPIMIIIVSLAYVPSFIKKFGCFTPNNQCITVYKFGVVEWQERRNIFIFSNTSVADVLCPGAHNTVF